MSAASIMFPRNEGRADRLFRAALGLTLLALMFIGPKSAWGLLGLFPLATAIVGSCPVYTLFGLSTRGPHRGLHRTAHQQSS